MQRAVETLGSAKTLADAVDVTPELVESWLAGTAAPSNAHYLAALDSVAHGALGVAKGSRTT